ncbi:MAG: hypothetical protein ACTHN4_03830 [Sphingomicrobium sp.]
MRFLAITLLAVLPAAGATAAQAPEDRLAAASKECPKPASHYAAKPGEPLKPRKLTELPPGNMYSAVYRRDANGCEAPIVVKYDVGRR